MITYVFLGFIIAITVVLVVAIVWGRAKDSLQHWGYNLTRESNRQLQHAELKLDSLLRGQERLERAISDLRSRVAGQKIGS